MPISPSPERLEVRTTVFDEALAAMRTAFGDVELQRDESGAAGLTLRSTRTGQLDATRWAIRGMAGTSIDLRDQDRPVFLTGVCLSGDVTAWSRAGSMDIVRPFIYPDFVTSRVSQPDVANLAVSVEAVTDAAAAMTAGAATEVRFTGTAPIDPSLDVLWRATMLHATRTLEALVGCTDVSLAHVGLVDHVAMTLLRVFPNTALELEERQREGRAQHPTLRRALQFIDDHLGEPFSVPELAGAARVSLRGLHAVFRRELDTTPMAYVAAARLASARSELERSDPARTAVAAVAMRWGFANAAVFARRYRQAYGEHPDQTLVR